MLQEMFFSAQNKMSIASLFYSDYCLINSAEKKMSVQDLVPFWNIQKIAPLDYPIVQGQKQVLSR